MIWHRGFHSIAVMLLLSGVLMAQAAVEIASTSTGSTKGHDQPAPQPVTTTDTYKIGVDDVLAISVWKEPEFSRTLQVRPDGMITLPLIGDTPAAGKTPQKVQQELHDKLAAYVAMPEVTVIVQEVKSLKYNIVGQVAKPGSYPLSESTTVLDALAEAGGVGIYAKSNSIYVLRMRPDGSSVQLPFHYKQVLKGTNLSQNVKLQAKDTVVVP